MEKEGDLSELLTIYKNTAKRCKKFMGEDNLKVQTTNIQEIYNHYQHFDSDQLLILDFRTKEAFENSHIVDSINVPCDVAKFTEFTSFKEATFLKNYCLTKSDQAKFKQRKRLMLFIICFENCIPDEFNYSQLSHEDDSQFTADSMSYRNALMFIKTLAAERHRYAYLCKTSMDRISDEYPFLCEFKKSVSISLKDISAYPSEIFEDCLYLGNANTCKDERILQNLGITHILNVSDNIPNYFKGDNHFNLTYENIYIEDMEDAPIHISFKQAYEFIENALFVDPSRPTDTKNEMFTFKNKQELLEQEIKYSHRCDFDIQTMCLDFVNQTHKSWSTDEVKHACLHCDINISEMHRAQPKHKLLVHCAMGKSRSAAIVTMFLMKKFSLPYKLATNMLKCRREKIDINAGFVAQLELLEENDFKFSTEKMGDCSESTEAEDNTPTHA